MLPEVISLSITPMNPIESEPAINYQGTVSFWPGAPHCKLRQLSHQFLNPMDLFTISRVSDEKLSLLWLLSHRMKPSYSNYTEMRKTHRARAQLSPTSNVFHEMRQRGGIASNSRCLHQLHLWDSELSMPCGWLCNLEGARGCRGSDSIVLFSNSSAAQSLDGEKRDFIWTKKTGGVNGI